MRRGILQFIAFVASLTLAAAETPGTARGLAIYKATAFRSDSTAVLIEYRSQQYNEAVTFFVSLKGNRFTVPANKSEVLFLPYPGKGEATPEEAFALLAIAQQRFPQFSPYYRLYERVWREEAKRPSEAVAAEISQRQANQAAAQNFSSWVKSLQPQLEPPTIPPSPLGSPVARALPAPSPVPEPASESESESEEDTKESKPLDLIGAIKQLQELYRLAKELEQGN